MSTHYHGEDDKKADIVPNDGASGSGSGGEDHDDKAAMAVVTDSPYLAPSRGTAPSVLEINSKSVDEGAELMLEFESQLKDVTDEDYAKVRRKIDWHLLPLMLAMYMIQFCDKTRCVRVCVLLKRIAS